MINIEPIVYWYERHRKEPEEVLREKLERVRRAMELKEPDRVPLSLSTSGHVLGKWYKLSEVFFNYNTFIDATIKFIESFPSDMFSASISLPAHCFLFMFRERPKVAVYARWITGPIHDILGDKYTRWPGREILRESPPQFIGGAFMSPEEYDMLIENPEDFVAGTIFPRVCTNVGAPGTPKYISAIMNWGFAVNEYLRALENLSQEMPRRGMPPQGIPVAAYSPLDIIADYLRGPVNTILDLRKYPDKVKQALEVLTELQLKIVTESAAAIGVNRCFMPLHLNEMLSPKLYYEFYWPYLKRTILGLYSRGISVSVFFEGDHTPYLESLLELPKGWGMAAFEKTDIRKAKKVLGGHVCISGGIPTNLVIGGTPEKIEEYTRSLMSEVAPGGGFIASLSVGELPPETPDENIRALINAILKYGAYRR